jgi:hypothetical protein
MSQLQEDDKHVQTIAEFLWQTWNMKTLANKIRTHFPHDDQALIERVTEKIATLHTSGDGYDMSHLIHQLEKLL